MKKLYEYINEAMHKFPSEFTKDYKLVLHGKEYDGYIMLVVFDSDKSCTKYYKEFNNSTEYIPCTQVYDNQIVFYSDNYKKMKNITFKNFGKDVKGMYLFKDGKRCDDIFQDGVWV